MTRRDYCPVCSEMVGDYDVGCVKCGVSLCHSCATPYDKLTYILLINARFLVQEENANITVQELNKYCENIMDISNNLFSEIDNQFGNYVEDINEYKRDFKTDIQQISKINEKYIDHPDKNEFIETDDNKKFYKNVDSIQSFLNDNEIGNFICLMCHNGIEVKY